jgi:cyclic di-GMP phosphodiesterase
MTSKEKTILIVDDEESIRGLIKSCLCEQYTCFTAASADEATDLLAVGAFNLVVTDITMPGASGIDLCKRVQEICPETVVVMVSAMTDISYAIEAMRLGAFDYVTKPFTISHLLLAVERALRYQDLITAKRIHEELLEKTVLARTRELKDANSDLNCMLEALYTNYRATLSGLAEALEARDIETRGHSNRVVANCMRLGLEMGLSNKDLIGLEQGALLHDIGKIGVPDRILLKPGALTTQEWVLMREHIDHGLRIINGIEFLAGALPVVGQHHEKYDGSGYPGGLIGDEIHINARIFAVADAFDAITSDRPYRLARGYSEARDEIVRHTGTHFDEGVVEAFMRIPLGEWGKLRSEVSNRRGFQPFTDKRQIHDYMLSLNRFAKV